ncbi:HAD family hydrolase [Nesterenkonia lutea]|uniref:Cof subfamily protein (Haloacid dehalogenase superfamily) n=1 Tax=Nesterenkonia lutea TaxID=272919 RepID=A0ABR9JH44_9MICC|nr:HAD family hydrolase [Nesterenkonia lutea]MBE1525103.1 Cof subfamily protein (haloacid dehalogenase superfamily) [Nesterenkonia lutea]
MTELSAPTSAPTLASGPVQLIASDIDGTILSYTHTESGSVSTRTVDAFHAAQAAGIRVVLVTGRPVRWLKHISEMIGALGTVIASNGAVTYDLAADRVLHENALDSAALFTVKDIITEIDPQASFAAETLEHLHMEEPFIAGSLFFEADRRRAAGVTEEELRLGPLDETLERDGLTNAAQTPGSDVTRAHVTDRVVKLLCKTDAMDPDEFLARVQHEVGDLLTVTHSAPGVSLLELSASGVNKASGLARYAAGHQIPRERVIAFGDMPNDIEMLRWAGTSWAVGSAHPLARSAADHMAASCDDDGVAQVIEKLLAGEL